MTRTQARRPESAACACRRRRRCPSLAPGRRRGLAGALDLARGWCGLAGARRDRGVGHVAAGTRAFDPAGVTRPFGALGDALVAPCRALGQRLVPGDRRRRLRRRRATAPAFFPLYPLARARGGGGHRLAADRGRRCCRRACFVGALVRAAPARRCSSSGPEAARWTVLGAGAVPGVAVVLGGLRESLFLMVSVGAVLAARTGRWALGGRARRAGGGDAQRRARCCSCRSALLWWRRARAPGGVALDAVPRWLVARARSGWRRSAATWPLARRRRARAVPRPGRCGTARSRGRSAGVATARVAAWDGVRQLAARLAAAGVLRRRRAATRWRSRGHNVVLFAFLAAGGRRRWSARCGGCRSPTAPTRWRARAAAVLPGRRRSR